MNARAHERRIQPRNDARLHPHGINRALVIFEDTSADGPRITLQCGDGRMVLTGMRAINVGLELGKLRSAIQSGTRQENT